MFGFKQKMKPSAGFAQHFFSASYRLVVCPFFKAF